MYLLYLINFSKNKANVPPLVLHHIRRIWHVILFLHYIQECIYCWSSKVWSSMYVIWDNARQQSWNDTKRINLLSKFALQSLIIEKHLWTSYWNKAFFDLHPLRETDHYNPIKNTFLSSLNEWYIDDHHLLKWRGLSNVITKHFVFLRWKVRYRRLKSDDTE